MENIFIAATPTSPEISFDFARHVLSLRGESYPENAAMFYREPLQQLRHYLGACDGAQVIVNIALTYFNSSSTKMLFNLFDALNDAAEQGNRILLNWYHDVDDDTILEFGHELHADFPAIAFSVCATTAS